MSEFEAQAASNQEHDHVPYLSDSLKSLLAGAVGGTLEVCTDHPIDLIKVRLQTAVRKSKKSLFTMISNIVREEGVMGLYRGASIRVITLMPGTAISFWGLDVGKTLVKTYWPGVKQQSRCNLDPMSVCWAGAFSALPVTLFATPSERIKCLLQIQQHQLRQQHHPLQQQSHYYTGPIDCARYLYRQGGVSSLYKGLSITLMRNIPGYSAWFGCYELCKQSFMAKQQRQTKEPSLWNIVVSGGIAGSFSWLVMIPFDCIKSRIQTNTSSQVSIRQAYLELTAKEGMAALFRGWRPAVLIAFPANAMCFLGMELAWKLLSNKPLDH